MASNATMDAQTAVDFLNFFEQHPLLTTLLALAACIGWVVKTDVLGFVSRRKRQRRADLLDTYEKLAAVGEVTDEERAFVVAELRASGEGLTSRSASVSRENATTQESSRARSRFASVVVRAADGVFSAYMGLFFLAMAATWVLSTALGFWMLAVSAGRPDFVLPGLLMGPGGFLGMLWLGPQLIREAAKDQPRVLEAVEWFERETEKATRFALAVALGAMICGACLGLVASAVFVVLEFGGLAGWSVGAVLALFGLALPVKTLVKLGYFGAERAPQPRGEMSAMDAIIRLSIARR